MKRKILFLVVAITLIASSCASIVSGSKQRVSITTTPANAKVLINGNNVGVTPLITYLKRSEQTLQHHIKEKIKWMVFWKYYFWWINRDYCRC